MKYLRQFAKNPKATGAIAASSRHLARVITEAANISQAHVVVELGTGNGVFTEQIVKLLSPGATFFAIEINPHFVETTKRRVPQATVYHDSAEHIQKYLAKHGVASTDRIICGLPWAGFDTKLQTGLMRVIYASLSDNGEFLTFAYPIGFLRPAAWRFRKLLNNTFSEVKTTRIVWRNLPPAFVYHCKKSC